MAIQEDASSPAAVTATTTSVTTASFTPVANSLLVAVGICGNNTGGGTLTAPVTDSLGSTWTLLRRANGVGSGAVDVWALDVGASPAARTCTVTGTGGVNAVGVELTVKVLTGASPVATVLGATGILVNNTAYSISLTSTTTGSLVVGGLVDVISAGALTANAQTTAWHTVSDTTQTEKYGVWRAASLTGTPGAVTYGYTAVAANSQTQAAVELLASTGPPADLPPLSKPAGLVRRVTWHARRVFTQTIWSTVAVPEVASAQTISPVGIVPGGVVGDSSVVPGPVTVAAQGIGTGELVGAAQVARQLQATGISSSQTLGAPTATQAISTTGIPSAQVAGVTVSTLFVSPAGISSAESIGNTAVAQAITAQGIPSGERFGDQTVTPAVAVFNTFEGGSDGTTITTANSGGTSGTAFDIATPGAGTTLAFEADRPAHGALGMLVATGVTAATAVVGWSAPTLPFSREQWHRFYWELTAAPATTQRMVRVASSGTLAAAIRVNSARQLQIADAANAAQGTMTTAITLNTRVRIEWRVFGHSSVGQIEVRLWLTPDSAGSPDETLLATGLNTFGSVNQVEWGWLTSSANVPSAYFDDIGAANTGWIGPVSAVTQTVNAVGIPSAERHGTSIVTAVTGVVINASGISSAEAVTTQTPPDQYTDFYGSFTVTPSIVPTGIDSQGRSGNVVITIVGLQTITASAIQSSESLGTVTATNVGPLQTITATGIPSAQVVGAALVGRVVAPAGILSGEVFGALHPHRGLLFNRTNLIYGSHIGAWEMDGGAAISNATARANVVAAHIKSVTWRMWRTPAELGGTQTTADVNTAIDGIINQLGAEVIMGLPPIWDQQYPAGTDPWTYAWQQWIVRNLGGRVRLYEMGNEPDNYGPLTAQQYFDQLWVNVPPLKAYARTLGFEIYVGGPVWTNSYAGDVVDIRTFLTNCKAQYDATGNPDWIPDFVSSHTYLTEAENDTQAHAQVRIEAWGKFFDDVHSAIDTIFAGVVVDGESVSSRTKVSASEWNDTINHTNTLNDSQAWTDFYMREMFHMFRNHRIWSSNQFTILSHSGDPLDLLNADGTPKPLYSSFAANSDPDYAPDAIISSNLNGNVDLLWDNPSDPDLVFLTNITPGVPTDVRVSFPTPALAPISGGPSTFRTFIRRTPGVGADPVAYVDLYEAGVFKNRLSTTTISSYDGQLVEATFNPATLSASSGVDVELRIHSTESQVVSVLAIPSQERIGTHNVAVGTQTVAPASIPSAERCGTVFVDTEFAGIAVSGAEFGIDDVPLTSAAADVVNFSQANIGVYDTDYHFDAQATLDYLAAQGWKHIRVPCRGERFFSAYTGSGVTLRQAEVDRLITWLDRINTAGMKAWFEPFHNYGYVYLAPNSSTVGTRYPVGGVEFTSAAYADLWSKLAAQICTHAAIQNGGGYQLMNEPRSTTGGENLTASMWKTASQAALAAIRNAENTAGVTAWKDKAWVATCGYNFGDLWNWATINGSPWQSDPSSKHKYEAHWYWGGYVTTANHCHPHYARYSQEVTNASGQGYATGSFDALHTRIIGPSASPQSEIEQFNAWFASNGLQVTRHAIIGEFGWNHDHNARAYDAADTLTSGSYSPDQTSYNTLAGRALDELSSRNIPWLCWSVGEWYSSGGVIPNDRLAIYYDNPSGPINTKLPQATTYEARL